MNFWIKRSHFRQQNEILSRVRIMAPTVEVGLNLYGRTSHQIEIVGKNYSFWIRRFGKEWSIRYGDKIIQMPDYGSPDFWDILDVYAITSCPPQPFEPI